jgi:hypothetical protein
LCKNQVAQISSVSLPVSFHWERFIPKLSSYIRNEEQLLANKAGIWLFSVQLELQQSLDKTKEKK